MREKRDCLSLYEGVCMKRFVLGGVESELMIVIQTFVTNQCAMTPLIADYTLFLQSID